MKVPWVILAPTATASRGVLRDDGFKDANTLAAFLKSREMQEQARGGLIWLDEAGMASGRDVAKLVDLASQLNSRIVLSGDRRQHRSIARGDVLAMLEDKAGLPVAELSEIKRQKGDYKRVAELLNAGRMPEAFERLDAMGWVKEVPFPTAPDPGRYGELVDDYLAALTGKKTALVVVPTHKEGDQVTAAIRDRLKQGGAWKKGPDGLMEETPALTDERTVRRLRPLNLTKPELELAKKNPEEGVLYTRYGVYREEEQQLAVGDQLRATAGFKDAAGRDIDSGTRMTLTGWTEAGNMRVRTASGAERTLAKDVEHVTAGYVSTSQAAQGRTVDHVMLWAPSATFGAVKMDTGYTTGTRGREKLTIYTDDKAGLLEAAQREDKRLLASDLVVRRGARERLKQYAMQRVARLREFVLPAKEKTQQMEMHR